MSRKDGHEESGRRAGLCGIMAALAFLLLVGLPYWLLNIFALSPCKDGPCDPNGGARLTNIAIGAVIAAAVLGLVVWFLVKRSRPRQG